MCQLDSKCYFHTQLLTNMKYIILSVILLFFFFNQAQVTIQPTFFDQDTEITVVYDATQGTGELDGITPVYMHAGLILQGSPNWQYVQGNWGTPDPNVIMEDQGNNIHTKTYVISDFHGIPLGTVVEKLAFVFRNADGSLEGKTEDGQDIFVCLPEGGFEVLFTDPSDASLILGTNEDFNLTAEVSESSDLEILINGNSVATEIDNTIITHSDNSINYGIGQHMVIVNADNGSSVTSDTLGLIVQGAPQSSEPPVSISDGINYIDDNTVILQIYAPFKDFIYVMGDFNNWTHDLDYFMDRRISDPDRWWVQIDNLTPGTEYRFQYEIDGSMRVADIYAEKLLDPWNDQWISNSTYPDLVEYPNGLTSNVISILETGQTPYVWENSDYQRPPKENLIVYELLLRDFLDAHDFDVLKDTLNYLENMGINAIELMPVNEFEGNNSWGYNPMFYFAPDKYYGPEDDFKTFIDECHAREIAVVMDMTLNHSFGLSPMVRMYFDPTAGQWGQPSPENPWFNEVPKHDFNVGFDFNHESSETQQFVDSVLSYWVQEYKIDGFRMDLSKGFTQVNTLGNTGAWGQYDQSRVDLWDRIGNEIWSVDPETYMILEHFANNSEEVVLANMGFMLWGNMNHAYNEATMGYSSNLNWGSYQARGWDDPHLITYMESHDEERLMYKNLEYGNSSGGYNITNIQTALKRIELAANFFFPIPGPKMIWQFGELGYDYSINTCANGTINPDCRLDPKPIKWEYFFQENRKHVYKVFSALANLKKTEPAFQTTDFNLDVSGTGKRIHLNHPSMNVTIIGNFDVTPINMIPGFQHTGTWYEYWTSEEIEENDLNNAFLLQPGEYRLYTDVQLEEPDLNTGLEDLAENKGSQSMVYPNPIEEISQLLVDHHGGLLNIQLLDINGRVIEIIENNNLGKGLFTYDLGFLNEISEGIYLIQITSDDYYHTHKIVID